MAIPNLDASLCLPASKGKTSEKAADSTVARRNPDTVAGARRKRLAHAFILRFILL
ncbi:MAG: hypothetical protein KGJ57_03430 [Sphingomonadales bacterium]|nr:hypothetical protein [Sphingomonadales bacterium]